MCLTSRAPYKGRDFAAWLGLVPRQISTGDRTILGKIWPTLMAGPKRRAIGDGQASNAAVERFDGYHPNYSLVQGQRGLDCADPEELISNLSAAEPLAAWHRESSTYAAALPWLEWHTGLNLGPSGTGQVDPPGCLRIVLP